MNNLDIWKRRYNVRQFDMNDETDLSPEIDQLCELFNYIPIQQSVNNHFWMLLDKNEQDFKKYIFENLAVAEYTEHMYPIYSAPYVFVAVYFSGAVSTKMKPVDEWQILLNAGFHGGALLSESLRLGLDTSAIACYNGIKKLKHNKFDEFAERVKDFVGTENLNKYLTDSAMKNLDEFKARPMLSICVGKGLPVTAHKSTIMYDNYRAVTAQKAKKPFPNIERRSGT